jgi:apolipoprotein D and lipocalin family protein
MRKLVKLLLATLSLNLSGCMIQEKVMKPAEEPKPAVKTVDLQRYAGRWYEIAAYPNRFERDCRCSKADYSLEKDYVKVVNSCLKGEQLKASTATGKAFVVPNTGNTQLKVQFFWPFKGDYWILALDPDYQYSLVGSPDRQYLWILARDRQIPEKKLIELKETAKALGFDPDQLKMTEQKTPPCLP